MACTTPGPAPGRREHVLRPRPPASPTPGSARPAPSLRRSGRGGPGPGCSSSADTSSWTGSGPGRACVIPGPLNGITGPGPGRACAMRAQRDTVHPASHRASPARRNPPRLDSRQPASHNASRGDITNSTPPGGGARATPTATSWSPSADSPGGRGRAGGARRTRDAVNRLPRERERAPGGERLRHCAADFPGAETRGGPGPGGHRSPPRQEPRLEIPRLFRFGEKYSIPLLKNLFGRPLNKFRGAEPLARGFDESRRQFFVKYRFFP